MKSSTIVKSYCYPVICYKAGVPGQVSATWRMGDKGRGGRTADNHQGNLTLMDGHS